MDILVWLLGKSHANYSVSTICDLDRKIAQVYQYYQKGILCYFKALQCFSYKGESPPTTPKFAHLPHLEKFAPPNVNFIQTK